MNTSDIKNYFNGVLGDRLRCLLPSFWFKRMFNMTLDKIDEVDNKVENIKIELPTSRTIANWGFTKNKGTVTSITAGEGINTNSGDPITDTGTISLKPASYSSLGGVKLYNITTNAPSSVTWNHGYANRSFGIEADSTHRLFVTVPPETFYGECDTVASVSMKSVRLAGWRNIAGIRLAIKFTSANTAANPSLSLPGGGSNKPIYFNGAPITEQQYWSAGAVIEFFYDGTYCHMSGAVNNTDTTITVDTAMSASSTNPVQNKVVKTKFDEVDNSITTLTNRVADVEDSIGIKEVLQATTSGTVSIAPNVLNKWSFALTGTLTITFASGTSGVANYYMLEFTTGSSIPTINLPSGVKWEGDYNILNNLAANTTYQISILNNLAVGGAFVW